MGSRLIEVRLLTNLVDPDLFIEVVGFYLTFESLSPIRRCLLGALSEQLRYFPELGKKSNEAIPA